jgi:hypothetical protein
MLPTQAPNQISAVTTIFFDWPATLDVLRKVRKSREMINFSSARLEQRKGSRTDMSESDSTKVAWSDEKEYEGQFDALRRSSRREGTNRIPKEKKKTKDRAKSVLLPLSVNVANDSPSSRSRSSDQRTRRVERAGSRELPRSGERDSSRRGVGVRQMQSWIK